MENKIKGGLFGHLIGDAIGVSYEFKTPSEIPTFNEIELFPPKGYKKTYGNVKPGTWSDDGAQALCLLDSLISKGTLDLKDFTQKMVDWSKNGLWAVNNHTFDIGNQTMASLSLFIKNGDPELSGFAVPDGQGNGSLMRVISLPLWHRGSVEELINFAHRQSLTTHGHITNQVCCAYYCVIARELLNNASFRYAVDNAEKILKEYYKDKEDYLNCFQNTVINYKNVSYGGGFVLDTIKSVLKAISESTSYEEVVKKCVAYGEDTDTTAAIAGGLAGIIYGYDSIPKRWIDNLLEKEKVDELLQKLSI